MVLQLNAWMNVLQAISSQSNSKRNIVCYNAKLDSLFKNSNAWISARVEHILITLKYVQSVNFKWIIIQILNNVHLVCSNWIIKAVM